MKKSRKPKKPPLPLLTVPPDDVLKSLHVDYWDVVVIGDGSGTGWEESCGWAWVVHDHWSNLRKCGYGAYSAGTSYLAEIMAHFHAIRWYAAGPGKSLLHRRSYTHPGSSLSVHLLSDSQSVVGQGNSTRTDRDQPEWLLFDALAARGYRFTWHWVPREQLGLHRLTDHLSRESRLSLPDLADMAIESVSQVQMPPGTSVYDFNNTPASQE